MVATRTVREVVGSSPTGFSYGHTFSGYPLGCAVGCAVIDTIEDEGLVAGAAEQGRPDPRPSSSGWPPRTR